MQKIDGMFVSGAQAEILVGITSSDGHLHRFVLSEDQAKELNSALLAVLSMAPEERWLNNMPADA